MSEFRRLGDFNSVTWREFLDFASQGGRIGPANGWVVLCAEGGGWGVPVPYDPEVGLDHPAVKILIETEELFWGKPTLHTEASAAEQGLDPCLFDIEPGLMTATYQIGSDGGAGLDRLTGGRKVPSDAHERATRVAEEIEKAQEMMQRLKLERIRFRLLAKLAPEVGPIGGNIEVVGIHPQDVDKVWAGLAPWRSRDLSLTESPVSFCVGALLDLFLEGGEPDSPWRKHPARGIVVSTRHAPDHTLMGFAAFDSYLLGADFGRREVWADDRLIWEFSLADLIDLGRAPTAPQTVTLEAVARVHESAPRTGWHATLADRLPGLQAVETRALTNGYFELTWRWGVQSPSHAEVVWWTANPLILGVHPEAKATCRQRFHYSDYTETRPVNRSVAQAVMDHREASGGV